MRWTVILTVRILQSLLFYLSSPSVSLVFFFIFFILSSCPSHQFLLPSPPPLFSQLLSFPALNRQHLTHLWATIMTPKPPRGTILTYPLFNPRMGSISLHSFLAAHLYNLDGLAKGAGSDRCFARIGAAMLGTMYLAVRCRGHSTHILDYWGSLAVAGGGLRAHAASWGNPLRGPNGKILQIDNIVFGGSWIRFDPAEGPSDEIEKVTLADLTAMDGFDIWLSALILGLDAVSDERLALLGGLDFADIEGYGDAQGVPENPEQRAYKDSLFGDCAARMFQRNSRDVNRGVKRNMAASPMANERAKVMPAKKMRRMINGGVHDTVQAQAKPEAPTAGAHEIKKEEEEYQVANLVQFCRDDSFFCESPHFPWSGSKRGAAPFYKTIHVSY